MFFGSGLCFFLENNGDPWHDYSNHADPYLTYFTSFYYMVVTMSTVGYGDISTQGPYLYDVCKPWLPDGYSQIFRSYVFGPSGMKDYGSAMLRCKI